MIVYSNEDRDIVIKIKGNLTLYRRALKGLNGFDGKELIKSVDGVPKMFMPNVDEIKTVLVVTPLCGLKNRFMCAKYNSYVKCNWTMYNQPKVFAWFPDNSMYYANSVNIYQEDKYSTIVQFAFTENLLDNNYSPCQIIVEYDSNKIPCSSRAMMAGSVDIYRKMLSASVLNKLWIKNNLEYDVLKSEYVGFNINDYTIEYITPFDRKYKIVVVTNNGNTTSSYYKTGYQLSYQELIQILDPYAVSFMVMLVNEHDYICNKTIISNSYHLAQKHE